MLLTIVRFLTAVLWAKFEYYAWPPWIVSYFWPPLRSRFNARCQFCRFYTVHGCHVVYIYVKWGIRFLVEIKLEHSRVNAVLT